MNDIPVTAAAPLTQHGMLSPGTIAQARFSTREALGNLFYHAKLLRNCLLLGLVIGVAGAVLTPTTFSAETLLLVLVGAESTAAQDASGINPTVVSVDNLKVVQSEIQIIQTDQILRLATSAVGPTVIYPSLARPKLFGLGSERDDATRLGEAVQRLHNDLRVESDPGTNVIRISLSNPDRTVALHVLEAVLDGYLTKRRAIYASTNAAFLGHEIDRYRQLLVGLDGQILDIRKHYDVLDMAQDIVLATNRQDGIAQRQNQVRERRVAVQTEATAVKTNLASQPATVLDFRETTNNTGNDEARNTLVRLEQQRTYLTSQFRPDWPEIAEINKKIAAARAQMGPKERALYFSEREIRNPALEVLNNRLASLEVEDKALGQQLGELDEQYRLATNRITALREAEGQLHAIQLTRDITEGIYRQLAARQPAALFVDNVVEERNSNLRLVQPPTAPTVGRSMALSYIAGGLFLGLLLGICATAIATVVRQTFITPAEVERGLALSVLAVLDRGDRTEEKSRPAVAGLAALLQETTIDGLPLASLQLVGFAKSSDRLAAIVQALGAELASGYERSTLILDLTGNAKAYAAATAQCGSAQEPWEQTLPVRIARTETARLWIAADPSGSVFVDGRASVARVRSALEELRQRFGVLLLVATADLSDHTMRRLSAIVDANVLLVRAEHTRGPIIQRLRESILAAGGNILGSIFVDRKYYLPAWLYRWT